MSSFQSKAAKQETYLKKQKMGPTTINKRPTAKKNTIMLSKMAARNQEVSAVGAWVEVEPAHDRYCSNAVVRNNAFYYRQP